MRILFTGGGGAGNEALWRLLCRRHELHFADADPQGIDPVVPEDRRHVLPWASDARFVDAVAELCRRLRLDVLVPAVDEELLPLARARDQLLPTLLLLPSSEYVSTMTDKLTMATALRESGIPVPATCSLADGPEGMNFPCVAKPRHGRGSRGLRFLADQRSAHALMQCLDVPLDSMVLQEQALGVEYTVQMVSDRASRLMAVVPVRVLMKKGVTLRGITENEPRVIAACVALHRALPASGCYNVQLIQPAEGHALPFEINPRVSTTLCLAVAAGCDPISVFLGESSSPDLLPFAAGIRMHRHWFNHLSTGEAT